MLATYKKRYTWKQQFTVNKIQTRSKNRIFEVHCFITFKAGQNLAHTKWKKYLQVSVVLLVEMETILFSISIEIKLSNISNLEISRALPAILRLSNSVQRYQRVFQ